MKSLVEVINEERTNNLYKFPVIPIGSVQKHSDGSIHTSKIRQEYFADEEIGISLNIEERIATRDALNGIILIGYTEGMPTEGQLVSNDSGKNIIKFKDAEVINIGDLIKKYKNKFFKAYVLK